MSKAVKPPKLHASFCCWSEVKISRVWGPQDGMRSWWFGSTPVEFKWAMKKGPWGMKNYPGVFFFQEPWHKNPAIKQPVFSSLSIRPFFRWIQMEIIQFGTWPLSFGVTYITERKHDVSSNKTQGSLIWIFGWMVNVNGVYHCKSPCFTIIWGICYVFFKQQTSKLSFEKIPLKAFIRQLVHFWGLI